MLDLSIVIVSWNGKDYLKKCLASIDEDVTRFRREVIVVDNASSDGSPDMVEESFPGTTLIRGRSNLGFAGGNNVGIRISRGRYVALVNSDVIVMPGCTDNLLSFLDQDKQIGAAGPRILNADGSIQPSCRRFPSYRSAFFRAIALDKAFPGSSFFAGSFMPASQHNRRRSVDVVSGCFLVVRREALEVTGLLDEGYFMYAEDVDWCRRFHMDGWSIAYCPDAQAVHFGGASAANDLERFSVEMHKADLRYWRKHHGYLGAAYYKSMLYLHQMLRLVPRTLLYLVCPSKRELIGRKISNNLACLQGLANL